MSEQTKALPPDVERFHSTVGLAFLIVQLTERALGTSLHMIFGLPNPATIDDIERLDDQARRATLGRLIKEVGARVSLDPRFEQVLAEFVADRNRFVHHLSEEGDLFTPEGRASVYPLINRLIQRGVLLQQTFASFMIAFARRVGVASELLDDLDGDEVLADVVADSKRVWGLVAGPLRARIMPLEFDSTAPRSSNS
jgi:hypothetical protein